MLRKTVPVLAVGALLTFAACGNQAGGEHTAKDGVKMGPGVSDSEIRVGILSDFSGPIAEAATAGSLGTEVKFDAINDAGGICGRKVVAVKGDTKYDPQQTTQAYRSTANDIVMISQILGTASLLAVKDSIERDGMPTMAISLNTQTLQTKDVYVPVPTFEVELMNGLAWAAKEAHASAEHPVKIGLATSTDENGDVYTDALKSAAAATPGVEVVSSVSFNSTDKDFTAPVSELQKSGADIVVMGAGPGEAAGMLGTSAQLGFDPTWVSNSGAWYAGLAKPLAGLLDNWYVSGGYGSMIDDNPGTNELKAALAKHAPKETTNNFTVAGWLFADATVAALQKACENKDLTRDGVTAALKDLKVNYEGITPNADFGDGDSIVSYSSRINAIGANGDLNPVSDYFASDAAKAWGEENGL